MKSNLKDIREHSAWLQKEAAEKLGISAAQMSRLENNNRHPSLLLALKIADLFELPVEEIWSM